VERTAIAILVLTSAFGVVGILSPWLMLAGYAAAVVVALRGVDLHQRIEFPWRRNASR